MTDTPFKPIDTLPYDQTVLIGWTDGRISQGYWYDQTLDEWKAENRCKPFHGDGSAVVPYCWMPEPPMPEPGEFTEG